jgi:radical SAM superfamily enzyme YgiQ (UPF0313 family)
MYRDKRYRVRPLDEVLEDVDAAAELYPHTRRVFLCDGDALTAGFEDFAAVCEHINRRFPDLNRISAYVNGGDLLHLSREQLTKLRSLKFSLGYLGLESGSALVRTFLHKDDPPEDIIRMARKIEKADIGLSVIVLLGAGGRAHSLEHVRDTIAVLNAIQPRFLSFLTTMIVPGVPLMTWIKQGKYEPLTDRAIMGEAHDILAGLELNATVFRMNHVSNLVPLGARLPKEKDVLLSNLEELIGQARDEVSCVCTEEEGLLL